ncbi:hypothetical protein [Phenylobacterium sp. SCN 70-31]|uniref:hypothetical protein n=1 Tax=Phenylobacterium sp. SCN 70-31 TaxID=1660129 RepID=UPI0008684EE9|nr:hypothetical protein [Phenylobacterium sp. SCN 70-31]ODT88136.1 MAG: hypothetical protein ABS78_09600 [Phenylobacterium sp. SCN 70-31]
MNPVRIDTTFKTASDMASALDFATGRTAAVAFCEDDGAGGVFVEVGYTLCVEDAEYVAATILRDIRRHMVEDGHPCDACARRLARVEAALAALEADGARPTGRTRAVQ